MASTASNTTATTSLEFVCGEVWGGNRPIDVPVDMPGLRGKLYSRPCTGGRGGDIHYLSVCSSGLLSRVCLADVAGHGEPVAQISSTIHRLLRRYMNWPDQRRVLSRLNDELVKLGFDALTTAVALTYYPPWRRLSVSYAGHPPAWLYRTSEKRWTPLEGEADRKRARGLLDLPLGAEPQTAFTRRSTQVRVGDRLLLLTDGVLDAMDVQGQRFGTDGLSEVLNENRDAPVNDVATRVLAAVADHIASDRFEHDDVTLLVVEFVPGPRGIGFWHMLKNRLFHPRGKSNLQAWIGSRGEPASAAGH